MEKNIVFPKCIPSKASARHVKCRFDNPAKIVLPSVKKRLLKVRKIKNKYFPKNFLARHVFPDKQNAILTSVLKFFPRKSEKKLFPQR